MAYYDALIAVWSTTGLPSGATGTALANGMTQQQKLDAINTWTVSTGVSAKALVKPSDVINAIVPADLAGLTQLQTLQFSLLMSGEQVDASPGTTIRIGVQNLFAGKTQTLANLAALVAPYDTPVRRLWRLANGYQDTLGTADLTLAGLS